jgi:hypothetical protein
MNQQNAILEQLKSGAKITAMTALKDHKCFRLSARIHDLTSKGHDIVANSKKIQTEDGIKWVAEYQYVSPSFENM